jgi:hypothetical protein
METIATISKPSQGPRCFEIKSELIFAISEKGYKRIVPKVSGSTKIVKFM